MAERTRTSTGSLTRRVVAGALGAPSPQNRQPWRVTPTAAGFSVRLDPARVAWVTDPVARQAHLALGAFVESSVLAASRWGATARVEPFPDGVDPADAPGRSPVAAVELVPGDVPIDPLARRLDVRHTNRRRYHGPLLADREVEALVAAAGGALVVVTGDRERRRLRELLVEAMRIDTHVGDTHAEKVAMIHGGDASAERAGDGFTYATLGYTGRARAVVEHLYPLRGAHGRWFRHGTVFQARRVLRTTPAMALLVGAGNARPDQLAAGRALLRMWLTAAALGIAVHPMTQILQELDAQSAPRAALQPIVDGLVPGARLPTRAMRAGSPTVQSILRLGRAAPTPASPRRTLEAVLG